MTPLAFAWRSLTRQPSRAILGVAGVAVVAALLFDMLLLSRGLQVSLKELLDSAGFDVRVTATDALPGTGPRLDQGSELVHELRALDEIGDAVGFRFGSAEIADRADSELRVRLIGSTGPARDTWTVLEGEGPSFSPAAGAPEVLVNRRVADALTLAVGDSLQLRGACGRQASALPPVEFRVAGIARFRFDARAGLTAVTDLANFASACDVADGGAVDMLLLATAPGVAPVEAVEAIRRSRPELHVFSNRQLVDRLQRTNFSYFSQVSFALSTVTLFFAFLLTATLLTVSVNQRLGEVAGLRALGFSRRRIVADLLCESGLLIGAGGLLSLPLGGFLALRLDAILRDMPDLPADLHFFVFRPGSLLIHASLLLATGVLASLYPIYLAARLPIAATLRRETVG